MMRHRFHSICPYFAMFPEQFVQRQLAWSRPKDLVMDPFCGRGTTIFEALLRDREAIGCDTNPVAVCISRAKADPPSLRAVLDRIEELEELCASAPKTAPPSEFFRWCYHPATYQQVAFMRHKLSWTRRKDDGFIAALTLGSLHGESHRSAFYLSNRMPRTISTKPDYSVRWWKERGLLPPKRDVYAVLRQLAAFRFASAPAAKRGQVRHSDVRRASKAFASARGRVKLVITSPPYLDTTNYSEDQWLRLWFLGGPAKPSREEGPDDRHRQPGAYWQFLGEAWEGIAPLLADGAHVVVRIGGRRIDRATCEAELIGSMRRGFDTTVRLLDRQTSQIRKRQAVAFHPRPLAIAVEHDFHIRVG
jgi:hypothetical protein